MTTDVLILGGGLAGVAYVHRMAAADRVAEHSAGWDRPGGRLRPRQRHGVAGPRCGSRRAGSGRRRFRADAGPRGPRRGGTADRLPAGGRAAAPPARRDCRCGGLDRRAAADTGPDSGARRALNKGVSGLVARRGARARDSVCGRTCSRFWREGPRLDVDRRPGLARWRAGLRPGRRRWPGIQAVWGVSVQTPAVRVRPRPMRLRRLSPAVRRVSHAWFLTVPR